MLSQLLIASHNEGKVAEIRAMTAPLGIRVLSAADAKLIEPEETGVTFAENAELKARHAMEATGMATLADDSGLVIPALAGAPGVYSARWAGPGKDFSLAFERIKRKLGDQSRAAYFMCVLCLARPDHAPMFFEGRLDGALTFPPRGTHGFGYDPIFIPEGRDITLAEMPAHDKNAISHRARAFAKFIAFIQEKIV